MDENITRSMGSVSIQMGGLELWTRYSMNPTNATDTSIHEFRAQEIKQTGGNQWKWKYLRDQFKQNDLEILYRTYDDKIRESLIFIYLTLLVIFSTTHIIFVVAATYMYENKPQSTYITFAMYLLRVSVPILFLRKCIYDALKQKWFWMPVFISFIITIDLVITDVAVPISGYFEGVSLRPAYSTMALLSVYIFLPMRNNFLVIALGTMVSSVYILIYAFFTYHGNPEIGAVVRIISDIIYHIGVNLMGIYFRLMHEVVTRRSFLDLRACVESTMRLKFAKNQEESLMLSILPEHLVYKMREDTRSIFQDIKNRSFSSNLRSVNRRYVQEHDNVSILYADVVNYTMISTTLAPIQMLKLLNELFGRFDGAALKHDVLRIKFLGDCYYCVSGTPKPTELHAKNCVDLGLDMISIIKDVREKPSLNIDMRIGVHSGKVLSGLIGIRKWQFDIWSKDVTIANKMESTGKAGMVHITEQTLNLLPDEVKNGLDYIIEPNYEAQNNTFIKDHNLKTFLLSKPNMNTTENSKSNRRVSLGINRIIVKRTSRHLDGRNSASTMRGNATTFLDENLVLYQQMLKDVDDQMKKDIENIDNGRVNVNEEYPLNRFTLMYKDCKREKEFLMLPDPLFKYYITCCLIICTLILLVNGLTTIGFANFNWYTWSVFGMLFFIIIIMQPFTWFQFLWTKYKSFDEPRNKFLRLTYDISTEIIKSTKIRTIIYLIISLGLAATSVINVISCSNEEYDGKIEYSTCVSSWHVTQTWGLALLLNFLFVRVFFMFKWIIAVIMTTFYLWVVWEIKTSFFVIDATWNIGLDPRISHTLSVLVITMSLYWIDRTTELRNRLDNLWQIQLNDEQKEAETMLQVNSMLLENILPAHVVDVYIGLNRSADQLYYEKYDNVAVMFASVTEYKLDLESDADANDKSKLTLLDEVISDFDRLLITGSSDHNIEKIKVAGWTYMAACGLESQKRDLTNSGRDADYSQSKKHSESYDKNIVLTLVEFAASMMKQLETFNRGSFQRYEGLNLRIGISNGKVAAGVVGSLKPLYDIWGHAVNMASRMDSTGENGKIQVTENTAIILEECGIMTAFRGKTSVKGAGNINTYFVPLDENFQLIKKETGIRKSLLINTDRVRRHSLMNNIFGAVNSEPVSFGSRSNSIYDNSDSDDDSIASIAHSQYEIDNEIYNAPPRQSYEPADDVSYNSLEDSRL